MNIRRINLDEIDTVVELFDQYRIFYKQPSDIAGAKTFLTERLSLNESVIFVAFIDDKPVGFTQLYTLLSSVGMSKNWLLNDLFVDQSARKKGVGKALIETAMAFGKERGATYIELETAADNHTAQSLYESIGFKKVTPNDEYWFYRISI